MEKFRRPQPQKVIEVELPGRGGQKIHAPHHLGDAACGVVHHHGQLIGVDAVCPPDDEVPAVLGEVFLVPALEAVLYAPDLIRHHKPPGRGFRFLRPLRRCEAAAGAGVDHPAIGGVGRRGGVKLCAGAVAGVDQPPCPEGFKGFLVGLAPEALGCLLFVPGEPQPG